MARSTIEAWLPEEPTSEPIRIVSQTSAIEALAKPIPMTTATKSVPRSGDVDVEVVPKGSAYGEDDGEVDEVVLKARKFGKVIRLAEEDIDDSIVDVINDKKIGWATSYAKALDNACLAVTAAENGTTIPFTSVYRALSQNDSATGYTANSNIIKTAAGAAVSYANLRAVVAAFEDTDYFDESRGVIIAHTSFRDALRGVVDGQGRPMFVENPRGTEPDTLFGYPIRFSRGAKTSAVATPRPTGNPIMVLANRDLLLLGRRSGPESVVIDGRSGASALTDETLLKMRSRRGFVLGHQEGAVILEVVPAA